MEAEMVLTPDRILALKAAADAMSAAPHGEKAAIAERHASSLGCDTKTMYRQIKEAGFSAGRKRRCDAGMRSISRDEAMTVMSLKLMAQRANGKDNMAIGNAANLARANGLAALGKVDQESGEVIPVSDATIARAVRDYGLDVKTLREPSPHRGAKSLHPNHVWQIDASVCVLYYLDHGGLGVMEADEFYKNKPENIEKKMKSMVIRYVCTDHYTGSVFFRYYLGHESGEMLCEFFIECIQPKDNEKDPFHGVPQIVVVDPGSANKGALFRNMLRLLDVRLLVHKPKNPRAKGSVEKHNDLIERGFESTLIGLRVENLEQLNDESSIWRRYFNGVKKHSRHGHTRYGLWQTIRQEQLRLAPVAAICRSLMTTQPEQREVKGDLTVLHGRRSYSVRDVPHLNVGQRVMVAQSPYREDALVLIEQNDQGRDVHWICPLVARDAAGFREDAPIWGEDFKSMPDTQAVKDMKEIEQRAYGVSGKMEVDAARRKHEPVYGGLDITSHLEAATPASYMPRPGTQSEVTSPVVKGKADALTSPSALSVEAVRLNTVQLAGRLLKAMPDWKPENYAQLQEWYPTGAVEDEIPSIVDRFRRAEMPLRLVAAGGM